ncbi:hypothetical protein HGRIS_005263 [Hohenbuehelia grisea]|uniref:Uncharacterized protein n=1 Tax=Hohenbuehelia grisea TaxID=104357 RepID=A0ABR3JEP4_9AGAR
METKGKTLYVGLEPDSNVIGFEGHNIGGPAAIAAKILVFYSDGFYQDIHYRWLVA